jgi:hypothetical protein
MPRSSHDPEAIARGIYLMDSVFLRIRALPKKQSLIIIITIIISYFVVGTKSGIIQTFSHINALQIVLKPFY